MPSSMSQEVPPQVDLEDTKLIDLLGKIIYWLMLFTLIVTLPIAFLASGGTMQAIWLHLGSMQLIAHLPMLGTYFPNNVERLVLNFIDLVNFKFVKMNPVLGIYKEYYEINLQGYSNNFIFSLGLLFIILAVCCIVGFIFYVLFIYALKKVQVVNKCVRIFKELFMYNFFIRIGLLTLLPVTIACFMNLSDLEFKKPSGIIAGILSILIAPIVFSTPFMAVWFLLTKRSELPQHGFIVKWESLYN